MNRIYQGRIADPSLVDSLWENHVVFNDAINYHLIALGALADPESEIGGRLVRDLRDRLRASWTDFPRQTDPRLPQPRSLRGSVKEWLGLGDKASLNEAFEAVLAGNEATPKIRTLALCLLLDKCGGESAIQQGGRGYLPRFVDAANNPTWDYSPEALAAASGADELRSVLHDNDATEAELEALSARMDLSWTVKVQPGKFYTPEESRDRLREGIDHVEKLVRNPSARLGEGLAGISDPAKAVKNLAKSISRLPEDLRIPRNRKANKDLTFASLLFQHFPSDLTRRILRQSVKKPTAPKRAEGDAIDFGQFDDDPIKLARGQRGYVFRAFTALPQWNPEHPGKPVWKELDIAAFKEALKSLNQFNLKTAEREEAEQDLEKRIDYMIGDDPGKWTVKKAAAEDETESRPPPRLAGDERYKLAKQLREELGSELDDDDDWGFTRKALRGLRRIEDEWRKLKNPTQKELEAIVKEAQKENPESIGSAPLFLELCKPEWHSLWQDVRDSGPDENPPRARHMLWAMVDLNQLGQDLERKREAINLTPAEPVHSRRLFMFSDIPNAVKFLPPKKRENGSLLQRVEVSIAAKDDETGYHHEERVELHYTAPRLNRDELTGGGESRWLQPMMRGLGLPAEPPAEADFESAVALMPDLVIDSKQQQLRKRMLLNFPVQLDPAWLLEALGKAEIWKAQFNGTRDRAIHLHWPGTATAAAQKSPWHKNDELRENDFLVLGIDFGQRVAFAWGLLRVTASPPKTHRAVRKIGNDKTQNWFAEIKRTGTGRLPGEGTKIPRDGKWVEEPGGRRGRFADEKEYKEAIELAQRLGATDPKAWVGNDGRDRRYPEQNSGLIALAGRKLSRLNTFHRWSCTPEDNPKRIKRTLEELKAWQDEEVKAWKKKLKAGDVAAFCQDAGAGFEKLRHDLESILVDIANRTVPLRGRKWMWARREPGNEKHPWGFLIQTEKGSDTTDKKIRSQRGISFARIEQLENLRRLFQRYNRSLDREPEKPAKFGKEAREQPVGEPCPDLLAKIDRIKTERINLTAHLILAQALGLRLKIPSGPNTDERRAADRHGEYEPIPGREPVDFIVIEDLSRYQFRQGRAPRENSRLMKWAHRSVRDKLMMLCEPFGIPVLEVSPGRTSLTCSETSRPGFRAAETQAGKKLKYLSFPNSETKERFEKQLKCLAEDEKRRVGKTPRTLIFPRPGGPIFIGVGQHSEVHPNFGPARPADENAAVNVALRAIAAPSCHEIHSRIRAERKGDEFKPVLGNKREKAAFSEKSRIVPIDELPEDVAKRDRLTVILDPGKIAKFGRMKVDGIDIPAAHLGAISKTINDLRWKICADINDQRLEKWGVDQVPT